MNELKRKSGSVYELQLELLKHQQKECPLVHIFSPGLYIREIHMPTDTLIVSEKHITDHPFFVIKGKVLVRVNEADWELIEAPFEGITRAGTKRVLVIVEDCIWATVHKLEMVKGDEGDLPQEEMLAFVEKIKDVILDRDDLKNYLEMQENHFLIN